MLKYNDFQNNNEMKKFSNISKTKGKAPENDQDTENNPDYDYESNLNADILAKRKPSGDYKQSNIKDTKRNSYMKRDKIQPNDKSEYHDKKYEPSTDMGTTNMGNEDGDKKTNEKKEVKLVGKIAKFPKDTKASKAYNFLKKMEDVKIPKNKIWYLLIEKQENELQMVKYQTKKGVNLSEFVNELKKFYIENYAEDKKVVAKLEKIELGGDVEGNFSSIKNIPNIKIDGVKCIRKITEDLTKLLSGKLDKRKR